jgi:hypothetical protein
MRSFGQQQFADDLDADAGGVGMSSTSTTTSVSGRAPAAIAACLASDVASAMASSRVACASSNRRSHSPLTCAIAAPTAFATA